MPFKSEAQRRKFGSLVKTGKMSQKTFDEWNKDTPGNLPDRLRIKVDKPPRSTDDLKNLYDKNYKKRFGL